MMVVPGLPAHGLAPPPSSAPSQYAALSACVASFVMVVTVRLATNEMDARASPLNPKVDMALRSSNLDSLDVVCRSQRMGRSASRIPHPLSVTCSSLLPPSFTVTTIEVAPASRLFSRISLSADAGRWMTSPAATRLTTSSASRRMGLGSMVTP